MFIIQIWNPSGYHCKIIMVDSHCQSSSSLITSSLDLPEQAHDTTTLRKCKISMRICMSIHSYLCVYSNLATREMVLPRAAMMSRPKEGARRKRVKSAGVVSTTGDSESSSQKHMHAHLECCMKEPSFHIWKRKLTPTCPQTTPPQILLLVNESFTVRRWTTSPMATRRGAHLDTLKFLKGFIIVHPYVLIHMMHPSKCVLVSPQ